MMQFVDRNTGALYLGSTPRGENLEAVAFMRHHAPVSPFPSASLLSPFNEIQATKTLDVEPRVRCWKRINRKDLFPPW